MKTNTLIPLGLAAAMSFLTVACDKSEKATAPAGASSAIPATALAEAAAEGAVGVVDARKAAKNGESIVLRGKVGGKSKPISDAAAILVLADEKAITSCDAIPGDSCETPWDYCCEEQDTITASIATIQMRGADGKIVRTSFRGLGGLKELSRLVISGTVDEASTPEALIVNATSIYVEQP